MIIKKNYIKKRELNELTKICLSDYFPWFLCNTTFTKDKDKQFVHLFYRKSQLNSPRFIRYCEPILNKLNPKHIVRMKLNLTWKVPRIEVQPFHKDSDEPHLLTSIFYLNTNNGYTKFKDKKVLSEANKLITFPSNVWHASTSNSSHDFRLVLNIVYERY